MSQVHVLVVDDDPALRDILQEALMRESYTVSTAEDGAGAMQAAKETVVHIVITDYQLPDIDGLGSSTAFLNLTRRSFPS